VYRYTLCKRQCPPPDVVKRLKEREAMLEDMKKLIEPAMSEHERLMIKYDIELDCRTEAENVARKMTAQNVCFMFNRQFLFSFSKCCRIIANFFF
jgi:hypothetical protein